MAGGLLSVVGLNANADTVTVQSGQTLSEIAAVNHTTVDALAQVNRIQNKNVILTGQKLNVTPQNVASPKTYTIKVGDTLSKIARQFNVSVADLMQWNHLTGTVIYPNQVLSVVNNGGQTTATASTNVANQQQAVTTSATMKPVEAVHQPVATVAKSSATSQVKAVQQIARPAKQAVASSSANNNVVSSTAQVASVAPSTQQGSNSNVTSSGLNGSEQAAADWIAQRESSGNWNAQNGRYYGRFQLDRSYLHGDYSPANQVRVFKQYCDERYGSVQAAQAFWVEHNYY